MAWLDSIPELIVQSIATTSSSEDRHGVRQAGDGLSVNWAIRLNTVETTTVCEAEGISYEAAKAWRDSAPVTREKIYGSVDASAGGISLSYPIVAHEKAVARSISRVNDAGAYKITETITEINCSGENLNA